MTNATQAPARLDLSPPITETSPLTDIPPAYLLAQAAVAPNDRRRNSNGHAGAAAVAPPADLPLVLESLLLVAEDPPTISQLAQVTHLPADTIEQTLAAMELTNAARGIRMQRHGSTVRLVSAPEAAPYIERFLGLERPNRLSKAALETLAIIAYRQPITRPGLEAVRGVSCDGPLGTLRARELIEPAGQLDTPGRPNLWVTTPRFLEHFGLHGINALPPLPEHAHPAEPAQVQFSEALPDSRSTRGPHHGANPGTDGPNGRTITVVGDSAEDGTGNGATPVSETETSPEAVPGLVTVSGD